MRLVHVVYSLGIIVQTCNSVENQGTFSIIDFEIDTFKKLHPLWS